MPGWQRMVGLLTDARDFTTREIHERLGALRWLSDEGHYDHRAFFQHVAVDILRVEFPMLPSDEELAAVGQAIALDTAEGLAATLCSERKIARGVRWIVGEVAGFEVGAVVGPQLLTVALGLLGGLGVAPVVASLCGSAIGGFLANKGIGVTCASLRNYVEEHRQHE